MAGSGDNKVTVGCQAMESSHFIRSNMRAQGTGTGTGTGTGRMAELTHGPVPLATAAAACVVGPLKSGQVRSGTCSTIQIYILSQQVHLSCSDNPHLHSDLSMIPPIELHISS